MTPLVVVALLAGGFILGWVGRSVRAAGREGDLLLDSQAWAAEATKAWAYADDLEAENMKLRKESAYQWDQGFFYGSGILAEEQSP